MTPATFTTPLEFFGQALRGQRSISTASSGACHVSCVGLTAGYTAVYHHQRRDERGPARLRFSSSAGEIVREAAAAVGRWDRCEHRVGKAATWVAVTIDEQGRTASGQEVSTDDNTIAVRSRKGSVSSTDSVGSRLLCKSCGCVQGSESPAKAERQKWRGGGGR